MRFIFHLHVLLTRNTQKKYHKNAEHKAETFKFVVINCAMYERPSKITTAKTNRNRPSIAI